MTRSSPTVLTTRTIVAVSAALSMGLVACEPAEPTDDPCGHGTGTPTSFEATLSRVFELWGAGDPSGALRCLSSVPSDSAISDYYRSVADMMRGNLHRELARPDSALVYLQRARRAADRALDAESAGDSTRFLSSDVDNLTGMVWDDLGRYDEAIRAYERSLSDSTLLGPEDRAVTINNVGVLHRRNGDTEEAVDAYREALALNPDARPLYLMNLGLAHGDAGRDEVAHERLREAVSAAEEAGDHATLARSFRHLAGLLHRMGRSGAALAAFDSAAAAYARSLEALADDRDQVSVRDDPGLLTLHQDWAMAILDRAGPDAPRRALAVADAGRARALLELMDAAVPRAEEGRAALPPLPTTFVYHLLSTPPPTEEGTGDAGGMPPAAVLTTWWRAGGGPVLVRRCALDPDALGMRVEGFLEQNGVRRSEALGQVTRTAGLFEAPLRPGRFRSGRDNRIAGTAPAVGERCPALDPDRFDGLDLARLLLPGDLVDGLPKGHEITLFPHDRLWALPFALLPSGGAFLGTRYALRYAQSLETQGTLEARSYPPLEPERGLILADPAMPTFRGEVLEPLPGARREGRGIEARTGARLVEGRRASEDLLRELAPGAAFLHLATHGVAFRGDRARESFVALAPDDEDGVLTVDEILAPTFPELPARLVVLSACQTGLGDVRSAEGTISLARSFLAKGARATLVSLWSVPDADTARLMERFYEAWLSAERPSAAEALRRAQEALEGEVGEGWRWGAFQLIGVE